jgi:hypothetical protein
MTVDPLLEAQSEIRMLARPLGCSPERLSYLEAVPPEEIRALREQVIEMLFSANETTFKRLASASRLLPVPLVALIGERAFTPVLAARITGLLDPSRAVEMAERMPIDYLASVAVHLDPRRAQHVIAEIPPKRVAAITRELADRGEFVTMGRFVGQLRAETLEAAVEVLDEAELLRAAFVMEEKERLNDLVGAMEEDRLEKLVEAARAENLWDEIIDLVQHLGPERRSALAQRARETGFFESLGPLVEALSA